MSLPHSATFAWTSARRRENADDPWRNAVDVRDPLADRPPLDAELACELVPEDRFVDVAGGAGLGEERSPIQRPPLPVRSLRRVADEDVRMNLRVAGAACPVAEGRPNEASTVDDLGSALAKPRLAGVLLEVCQGSRHRPILRAQDRPLDRRVADPEQHRRTLGDREHEVVARNACSARRALQGLAGSRVALGQDRPERRLVDAAVDAGNAGTRTDPFAGSFRPCEEVVLRAGRHALDAIDPRLSLFEVVTLIRAGELDEREHPL